MPRQIRLGILVPSSNTALEPLTTSIISSVNNLPTSDVLVSLHFSRFKVTDISLTQTSSSQFDLTTILSAASLLADAHVDAIGWSGTSAGWLGFETDERLCNAITQTFNIPATTSTLALNQILARLSATELGLVTPYSQKMNAAIRANYQGIGINIPETKAMELDTTDNHSIAAIDERTLTDAVRNVRRQTGVRVLTTFCTNLKAAHLVYGWENETVTDTESTKNDETGKETSREFIVLDSVSTVVWGLLKLVEIDTRLVQGWGRIFDIV